MTKNRNPTQINRARHLRRTMTSGEQRLWSELKQLRKTHGFPFRKQVPIDKYVVDFACISARLIVEVDGEHHFAHGAQKRDALRNEQLSAHGYRVFRINTGELSENLGGCVDTILCILEGRE